MTALSKTVLDDIAFIDERRENELWIVCDTKTEYIEHFRHTWPAKSRSYILLLDDLYMRLRLKKTLT